MKKDIIDKFFEKKIMTSYNTKRLYRLNIENYFKRLNKNMETYFQDNNNEEIEEDLRKVYMQLDKIQRPLLSRRTYFNSIKQFFISNDKDFKDLEFWETLKTRLKGAEAESEEFIPNLKDLKTVLAHSNTLSRAMYLMLASSGRRIEEILALYPEDVDTSHKPTRIRVNKGLDPSKPDKIKPHTKSHSKRPCFISNEATESYNAWMKERDSYLKTSVKKMRNRDGRTKNKKDKRVFPMSYSNALYIWKLMVQKSGLFDKDERTHRVTLHPHCTRKFFRSYLGDADLSEHLMGHSHGLVKIYRNMKIEDLAEKYNNYMHNVTVFESTPDLSAVNESLAEKDKELKDIKHEMEIMRRQMNQLMTDKLIELDKRKK